MRNAACINIVFEHENCIPKDGRHVQTSARGLLKNPHTVSILDGMQRALFVLAFIYLPFIQRRQSDEQKRPNEVAVGTKCRCWSLKRCKFRNYQRAWCNCQRASASHQVGCLCSCTALSTFLHDPMQLPASSLVIRMFAKCGFHMNNQVRLKGKTFATVF